MEAKYPRIQEEIKDLKYLKEINSLDRRDEKLLKELETLMDSAHGSSQLKEKYPKDFQEFLTKECKEINKIETTFLYKKRVELIVKEWFELKTGVCLSDEVLSNLVDDITETKQCDIPIVSQQRELLIAFEKQRYIKEDWKLIKERCIKDVDEYLSNL